MTMTQEYLDEQNKLVWATSPRWYRTPKRIRVIFAGEAVADSTDTHLLRDGGPPVYYFPEADVRMDLLTPTSTTKHAPTRGLASYCSLTLKGRTAEDGVWAYDEPVAGSEFLKGHVAFDWNKMDAWFEETEEVYVHARDPFKRIETLKTDREIRVVVNGETVAETNEAVMLLEPGHPIRYYLPMDDVRLDVLRPSATTSRCAYKGLANYYSIEAGGSTLADAAWVYRYPAPEVVKVTGMLCFFNERVDAIHVDGQELAKPVTNWAR